jgi:hypothetical protein
MTTPPMESGLSLAPTTATDAGLKSKSSRYVPTVGLRRIDHEN